MLAYERALGRAPGDGLVLERLEALGALMRIEGPDGEVFWLTPGDFDRVMRRELASAATTRFSSSRWATGCWAGAVALAAWRPAALAGGEDLRAPGRSRASRDRRSDCRPRRPGAPPRSTRPTFAVARALVQRRAARRAGCPRPPEVQRRPDSAAAWIVLGDQLAAAASRARRWAPTRTRSTSTALPDADHAREALRVLG